MAIVGGSGAGKTTLVDVLLGALDAQMGFVEISGVSPRSTFSRWPGAVSYVPQDIPVINGTIRENLGLGYQATEINEEFCWESLRIARLDNFVKNLPNLQGYHKIWLTHQLYLQLNLDLYQKINLHQIQ